MYVDVEFVFGSDDFDVNRCLSVDFSSSSSSMYEIILS